MKKSLMHLAPVSLLVLAGAGTAWGQDEQAAVPAAHPVETYTCKYNNGKGPADLDKVLVEWNAWMDKQDVKNYFGAVITPYYSGDFAFDVGWLGVWPDGNAMGSVTDVWTTKGGDMAAKINTVVDCTSHLNFVSLTVKQPSRREVPPDKPFILSFANCSMKEDKTFDDLMAAQQTWNTYADANGFTGGAWVMFPLYGETDNDYDFKFVESGPDFVTFGADYQRMPDGAWRKAEELYAPVMKCDHGRLYIARGVRDWDMEQD